MPLHDIHYQHWEGVHCGIWMRRWIIARNGLTACLRNKFMRNLVVLTWILALSAASLLFFLGQLLVPDSMLVKWIGTLNENLQGLAGFLTTWLAQHPEISVRTTQNVIFYFFGIFLMPFSIFALGMTIPFLVTRDLATNAIIIYSSKAVTRGDYLLGKFCSAFGLLAITWLGPVCGAWLVGNLLAPDWKFFWHARVPLLNALLYGLPSMAVLSLLALGVSSVSNKDKSTVSIWFAWWVLGWPLAEIASHTKPWLAHFSFSYNIRQIAISVFDLGSDLKTAQNNIPILGSLLHNIRPERMSSFTDSNLTGSIIALTAMLGLAFFIINKRVKP